MLLLALVQACFVWACLVRACFAQKCSQVVQTLGAAQAAQDSPETCAILVHLLDAVVAREKSLQLRMEPRWTSKVIGMMGGLCDSGAYAMSGQRAKQDLCNGLYWPAVLQTVVCHEL